MNWIRSAAVGRLEYGASGATVVLIVAIAWLALSEVL